MLKTPKPIHGRTTPKVFDLTRERPNERQQRVTDWSSPPARNPRISLKKKNKAKTRQTRELQSIKLATAFFYGIKPAQLYAEDRHHALVVPRQVAMFLCREIVKASFPDIAAQFGKTHGTIMHACRIMAISVKADEIFASQVQSLREQIEASFREQNEKNKAVAS